MNLTTILKIFTALRSGEQLSSSKVVAHTTAITNICIGVLAAVSLFFPSFSIGDSEYESLAKGISALVYAFSNAYLHVATNAALGFGTSR
jgi:hypothetical protein